ncbi:unnamed protein product [Linum trigynum]|uniref:Uncharacterized protein n=1 Tax=Linum trigynum TaxID=586398 RepID=A0AAV2CV72_9ROSI
MVGITSREDQLKIATRKLKITTRSWKLRARTSHGGSLEETESFPSCITANSYLVRKKDHGRNSQIATAKSARYLPFSSVLDDWVLRSRPRD